MKPKVYIETTIPSFYYEVRPAAEMVARREWTREWWHECAGRYTLVTSVAVLEELQDGEHPHRKDCLALVANIPLLPVAEAIIDIVKAYVAHRLMPRDPTGDALHLALASYHGCHFLLTWNCTHLANANKVEHIRHLNTRLGLHVPILTTPLELLRAAEYDDES